MEGEGEIILVFSSNTAILNAEDLLEELELPFTLVPVPKEVNPNCGLALCFMESQKDRILGPLKEANLWPLMAYCRRGPEFSEWPLSD
jgi:hypothetical protein